MSLRNYNPQQRAAIVVALALATLFGLAIPSWALCVSETLDLGRCDRCLRAQTERQSDGSWSRECLRWRTHTEWSQVDKAALGFALAGMASDLVSTAYFLHADACGGRIREANPLVPNVGVLAALKVAYAGVGYLLGESFGGKYRSRMWLAIGAPQHAVGAWNFSLISKHC